MLISDYEAISGFIFDIRKTRGSLLNYKKGTRGEAEYGLEESVLRICFRHYLQERLCSRYTGQVIPYVTVPQIDELLTRVETLREKGDRVPTTDQALDILEEVLGRDKFEGKVKTTK